MLDLYEGGEEYAFYIAMQNLRYLHWQFVFAFWLFQQSLNQFCLCSLIHHKYSEERTLHSHVLFQEGLDRTTGTKIILKFTALMKITTL